MLLDKLTSVLRDVALRIGRLPRSGLFTMNLSSRYRWYLAPARLVIMLLAGGLVAMLWDISGVVGLAGRNQWRRPSSRLRPRSGALKGSTTGGLDLSRCCPASPSQRKSSLRTNLVEKRSFSWTRFLTELEQGHSSTDRREQHPAGPGECHDHADEGPPARWKT